MEAGSLVPQGGCRDNDAAVPDGFVQHPAGAEQHQLLHSDIKQLLQIPHTSRRAHIGFKQGNLHTLVLRPVNRGVPIGLLHPGDFHSAQPLHHPPEGPPLKAGHRHLWTARNRRACVGRVDNRHRVGVKFMQQHFSFLPVSTQIRYFVPLSSRYIQTETFLRDPMLRASCRRIHIP